MYYLITKNRMLILFYLLQYVVTNNGYTRRCLTNFFTLNTNLKLDYTTLCHITLSLTLFSCDFYQFTPLYDSGILRMYTR